jgi:transcriptional regulator with XRE-family HTH domain
MDVAAQVSSARRRAGLSQRELAVRAGTSQATVSAYEAGRKQPTVAVLDRLLRATGAELRVDDAPGRRTGEDLARSGSRLVAVMALAEELPFRRPGPLRFPRLPTTA